MKLHAMSVVGLALLLGCPPLQADDWPQWRGPQRNGISQEIGLLGQWPEGGPKLAWQVTDLGMGFSTPSVVGDRLFLLSNQGLDNEYIEARSVADGSTIWAARLGNVGNPDQQPSYPAARSTPTVDGQYIYALGSNGDLACLAIEDGTIRWQKNIREEFGGEPGTWAYAESPLIDGDVLVCTPGGSQATIVALNKNTGELIWKCVIPEAEAAYASAIVVGQNGTKQYVQFLSNALVGVDAPTGELLWQYSQTAQNSPANIPTPVAQDGYIYSAASRSGGGLVKLNRAQDGMSAEPVYFSPRLPSGIGGTVLLEGHLYGTNGQVMLCTDFLTGDIKWQERGIGASSVCYADGRLYLHGENGDVALVEPSTESYQERGRFSPPNPPERGDNRAWTHPVVANGKLYIRELQSLWCFDVAE